MYYQWPIGMDKSTEQCLTDGVGGCREADRGTSVKMEEEHSRKKSAWENIKIDKKYIGEVHIR